MHSRFIKLYDDYGYEYIVNQAVAMLQDSWNSR